ncbi:hypothetical protein EHQ12_11835 [Leptospira gomenensis]|uniref:Uncharacterized protein n=1 Tax=Leptospira gomenensis TaxID=2484974 RepID=A0A5F1YYZ0_9LEPT|nr:hypothetical protein [Leptospira gomenensis]TGK32629.1 hypothetical protein EHQ17_11680 [Leptospira gomenensis]TGK36777.1 hypothetical protein EHQ12_11835 [Leptospira gomenensis]TGK48817.1 hypothetical protein EHQ07_05600 [Leptospira gomenensis]TGK64583.1 hypothetical protein EHQ13_06775 [Leptospira gomenensis]
MLTQIKQRSVVTTLEKSKVVPYSVRIFLSLLIGFFSSTNCNQSGGNQSELLSSVLFLLGSRSGFQLNTTLKDSNSINSAQSFSLPNQVGFGGQAAAISNDNVQGLFINYLEATAFDYRPDEEEQESVKEYGVNAPDWSYWLVVPPPGFFPSTEVYESAMNNVLKIGGEIHPDWYRLGGISGKRDFEIDAFSLTIDAPGLVYNDEYFGVTWGPDSTALNGKHPLFKYEQWSDAPIHTAKLDFPGFHSLQDVPGNTFLTDASITVIFIRNDVLTAPAQIQLTEESYIHPGNYLNVGYKSRTLTDSENDFVLSMLRQSYPLTYRTNILLIPFDGPITIVFEGETNLEQKRFLWKETDIQIGFDLSNIIDTDPTKSSLENLSFMMKGDTNNVPFGMNMKVVRKEIGISK